MDQVKPCVIVVNDDLAQLELISTVIEQERAQVYPFSRAADALAYISRSADIDLIVTDLHMPGIDGWRFCHLLRSSEFPSTNETPILVVSATLSPEDAGTIPRDVGADAFLSMPYTPDELLETVHQLLHDRLPEVRHTVLIVAQSADERQQLVDGFASRGYQTFEAETGQETGDLLSAHRLDVIVLDHAPPEIDGLELISSLKADQRAVVLAITDGRSPELAIELMNRGADAHLAKPYQIAFLIDQVTRAQQGRVMLHVETAFETWAQEALRNARRIQHLNDGFLALGTDHNANIQALTRASGELLNAHCAVYDHRGMPEPYTLTYQVATGETALKKGDAPLGCLGVAQDDDPRPVVVQHLQETAYADAKSMACRPELQTYVECPILAQQRRIGSLCVGYTIDYEPSDEDLNILQLLARVIGRQEQLEQRERELVALGKISRVVTSTLTLDEALTELRREVREVTGAKTCSIALIDPRSGELVFRQADDPLGQELVGRRLQPGQGIAGQVAQTGQSMLVLDARADPNWYPGIDAETGLETREIVCSPLIARNRTIGVIEILNKRYGSFIEDDIRLLESVAAQVSSALETARLYEVTQRELSDRIKAEEALRESKTRLQTFVDVTPDLIYLKNRDLRYLLVNQAFMNYWRLAQSGVLGKSDLDFMPRKRAEAYQRSERQVMAQQRDGIVEEHCDGRVYEIRRTPVIDEGGQTVGIAGVIRDVTERRQLQERLIRGQKEQSILTLATGIAHDFNNALVGIVGNIDILRLDLPDLPDVKETLHAMELSAQRMVDLTSQLLAYAGGGIGRRLRIDLNAVVRDSLKVLQVPKNVFVQRVLATDLWHIDADPNQTKQVLFNLMTNACEAMAEGGGTLIVHTENTWRDSWTCSAHRQHPAGEYVHLRIEDTGTGIDNEVRQHLFEPFFSTKFLGRGLGLAATQGIVRDHNGCIDIESTQGQGTVVHVYLPRSTPPPGSEQQSGGEADRSWTFLVIEDEPVVGNLIRRALGVQGHTVVLVSNGTEAIQIYDRRASEFDAVFLDIEMSGNKGTTLLSQLRSRTPDVRVLLTSSYSETAATQGLSIGQRTQYLQKPFSLEELDDKVQLLLNA